MDKKYLLIAVSIVVLILWLQPLNIGRTEVVIPDNVSAREIASFLVEQRIVRNIDEFLIWLRLMGREKQLKSGKYELYKFKNPVYVINNLSSGGRSEVVVTIPEGLTIHETAKIIADHGLIDYERFVGLCSDSSFISSLDLPVGSLEGYFFPDTYSFSNRQSEEAIIATLVGNFRKHIADLGSISRDSLRSVIILASIIEKEAKYEDERAIIARVFLNRLATGRPLESCATVFYALKEKYASARKKLMDRDLKIESPYNTYLHTGLPPGPICSPGESSIRAVLAPADVDYLYFVARGDGRHHFSRTYREHVLAKEKYQ